MKNIEFCNKKFIINDENVEDVKMGIGYRDLNNFMDDNLCKNVCIDEEQRKNCKFIKAILEMEEERRKKPALDVKTQKKFKQALGIA